MLIKTRSDQSVYNLLAKVSKILRWRWISILLLGLCTNTIVNAVFDYKYQRALLSLDIEEYINALIVSAILLEGTRWVTLKLNRKFPWESGIWKRVSIQLGLQLAFIVVTLNCLLIGVTYFFYGGFYQFDELIIINITTISLTFLFSIVDLGIFFYMNWRQVSNQTKQLNNQRKTTLQVSIGNIKHLVKKDDIVAILSQSGSVIIHTREGRKLVEQRSLDSLEKSLDSEFFFRVNRQMILYKSMVLSIKTLEYGKVQAQLTTTDGLPDNVVISRAKAAQFRKWLKS